MKTIGLTIAILLIAGLGYLWFQQSTGAPYGDEIVTQVDRGLKDEDRDRLLAEVAEKEAEVQSLKEQGEPFTGALLETGNLYYTIGDLGSAVAAYQEILRESPQDAPALENIGQAFVEMGAYDEAEAAWRAALLVHPVDYTYLRLFDLYTEDIPERQHEALPLMEEAIQNLGQKSGLLKAIAKWYADNDMYDEAISHYNVVLQLEPNNSDIKEIVQELREEKQRAFNRENK